MGINSAGLESGNPDITKDRSLPWLQDTTTDNVENTWPAQYRDVVIVDAKNHWVTVYNLTINDLSVAANYDALKKLLLDTANAQ